LCSDKGLGPVADKRAGGEEYHRQRIKDEVVPGGSEGETVAYTAGVSKRVIAALIGESDLCSRDIAEQNHRHISEWLTIVVRDRARDGKRSWSLSGNVFGADGGE